MSSLLWGTDCKVYITYVGEEKVIFKIYDYVILLFCLG